MQKQQLGKSDIYISSLTLGCMSLGTDPSHAARMIDTALDLGINHLDTADLYDFGKNEEIVGAAIKQKRSEVVLTSKVGNHFDKETGESFWDPSKAHIIDGLKASLRRLQTDYVDFYMLHGGTIEDPIDESIDAFETLKKEGWIRAYGISSIRPNVIREYVKRSSIDGVMMQYSLLDRRPEETVLDLLQDNQISVLARGPLAKGMLSNTGHAQVEKKGVSGYLDYDYAELKEIVAALNRLDTDQSPEELALSYVLSRPSVATAVFGASSLEQLKANANASLSIPLPESLYQQLQQLTKAITYSQHR